MAKSVMVVVPTLGKLHYMLVTQIVAWAETAKSRGDTFIFGASRGIPISANRNGIVRAFLARPEKPEYLLMIDDDIVPQSNLLEMLEHDYDVVSADCTAVRTMTLENGATVPTVSSASTIDNGDNTGRSLHEEERPTVLQVNRVGTGCVAIHRRVLEAIAKDGVTPFLFRYNDNQDIVTSEDYYFCERALERGFKLWHYGKVRCMHFKELPV